MATDSDIQDLREAAGETIYLVPMSIDGGLRYAWCDDPAPEEGMDASEAVEYVRRDKYDALAAHVVLLRNYLGKCRHHACYSIGDAEALAMQMATIRKVADQGLSEDAETSLARRDARAKAEALDDLLGKIPEGDCDFGCGFVADDLRDEYRRQAEEPSQ